MTVETQSGGDPVLKSGPYNGNGSTSVFDFDFQVQAEAELLVTRLNADLTETVLVLTTDYTVSGVGADDGGQITLVDAATDLPTGASLVIQYDGNFNQSTDYSNQSGVNLATLEAALDKITMHLRQLKDIADRAITTDAFSATDLATLVANINALAAIASDISTVAGDIADVSTVAGDSTEIQALGLLTTEIAALAAITADITAAAAVDTDITAVAAIAADITTVAGIAANVTTVAGFETEISDVAAIDTSVVTVAGLDTEIAALGSIAASITAVAAIDTEVTTVAGDSDDIQTLAGISADITALATANGGTLTGIWLFSSTAYLGIPRGTTAQRGTPGASIAAFRYNTTLSQFEGWDGSSWGAIGGGGGGLFKGENGEQGSSAGDIFRVHEQTLNTDTTIDADENAIAAGPLEIANGVTLTVTSGGNLSIV